jgi:hypothetical protein
MRRLLFLLFGTILLFTSPLYVQAQDARVIELKRDDAVQAAKLYEEMKSAEKRWEEFQAHVKSTYLTFDKDLSCEPLLCFGDARSFDNGFIFSSDFRFIVPKPVTPQIQTFWNSCNTVVPVVSTNSPGGLLGGPIQ